MEHKANIGAFRCRREQVAHSMARSRFHATDGSACVLDAVGGDVRRPERPTLRPAALAGSVMAGLDDPEDRTRWRVGVQDRSRRVLRQPFVRPADAVARAA